MNRSCVNVGKTRVLFGGAVPLNAICSTIQKFFWPFATCDSTCVQSPNWLTAVFVIGGVFAPPHATTGELSIMMMSAAALYGCRSATVPRGACVCQTG